MAYIVWLIGLLAINAAHAEVSSDEPQRPNILIIFTDDQGYAALGAFGSTTHATPRMDRLAAEGTKFTSFYAQTVCGPSRSVLSKCSLAPAQS